MPEGHTIHRHARMHAAELGGQRLAVSSPQGWASDAAQAVDGKVLTNVDAYGKHLLYRFEDDLSVHVHLGLFGGFRRYKLPGPPARETTRLRFIGDERGMDLAGAVISQLIDPAEEDALMARLGPDPLRRHARADRMRAALARRKGPIGGALLDQSVIAGLGNVYRAEILFACGIDPLREARSLSVDEVTQIWKAAKKMLAEGERSGKIVTVPRREAGKAPSKLTGKDRHQVYKRERCRRCGTPVRSQTVATRTLFWCPNCQAAR
ncbi:MAG TPA: DNA-formamidopyrimidine glycosylase family protein [Thermoleophilaceae bacterium]|nr:DNA-formamidopyrimidine glycosylase family protein [Thermoleophilaceae bacterium]